MQATLHGLHVTSGGGHAGQPGPAVSWRSRHERRGLSASKIQRQRVLSAALGAVSVRQPVTGGNSPESHRRPAEAAGDSPETDTESMGIIDRHNRGNEKAAEEWRRMPIRNH